MCIYFHQNKKKRVSREGKCHTKTMMTTKTNGRLQTHVSLIVYYVIVVYYESLKRALKTKTIYGYRCDERLQTNVEESTLLGCTPLCAELEHLKIETRLTSVYY